MSAEGCPECGRRALRCAERPRGRGPVGPGGAGARVSKVCQNCGAVVAAGPEGRGFER